MLPPCSLVKILIQRPYYLFNLFQNLIGFNQFLHDIVIRIEWAVFGEVSYMFSDHGFCSLNTLPRGEIAEIEALSGPHKFDPEYAVGVI